MLKRPRVKSDCRVAAFPEEKAIVLYREHRQSILQGSIYLALIPLLDGKHTTDEIIGLLNGKVSADKIYYALMVMEQKGYITETVDSVPAQQAAYWESYQMDVRQVWNRLQHTVVSIRTLGNIDPQPLVALLEGTNIRIADQGDLFLVLTEDYLDQELSEFSRWAAAQNKTWLPIKANGTTPWVGPIVIPNRSACWECLRRTLNRTRRLELSILDHGESLLSHQYGKEGLPSTIQLALSVAATETAKWIASGESRLADNIVSIDTHAMRIEEHTVSKQANCSCCGSASTEPKERTAPAPVVLQHVTKTFTADGGHRVSPPEATYEKLKHLVSPITGIVNHLQKKTFDHVPLLHVYSSGHNYAIHNPTLQSLRTHLRSYSAGKGMTDIQAKVGAICEAIERYSGIYQGDERSIRGTLRELGEQAIHPNLCMGYSESQYQQREAINAKGSPFNYVPDPFDIDQEMDWTPVWSLTKQAFRYLPTSYCYYNFPTHSASIMPCSNGSASGNTLEEAVLQGFFELIERDSVAIWWYNRLHKPEVALESFNQLYFKQLREQYSQLNRELWVLDLTSDLGIPVFAALSRRTNEPNEEIIFGFGCHFDAELAITRAITEMNQCLSHEGLWQSGAEAEKHAHEDTIRWMKTATCANQPHLLPDPNGQKKEKEDYLRMDTDDFFQDIMICKQIIEDHGMEMLVLDQTRAETGMSAVKVIVPGLRHFWARFAPGRLYDVPVQMGWLDRSKSEHELNPIAMFF